MKIEEDLEFAFKQIESGADFAPMAILRHGDQHVVMILMWDDESKRPMVKAMSMLAGALGCDGVRLLVDVWYAIGDEDDPWMNMMPRSRPDRGEAILVLDVSDDGVTEMMAPYQRTDEGIVRLETREHDESTRFEGWMLETIKAGLAMKHHPKVAREAARSLGIDFDDMKRELKWN